VVTHKSELSLRQFHHTNQSVNRHICIEDGLYYNNDDRILRGTDYLGRICGKSEGVTHLPYAAWPMPAAYEVQVCVANCNFTTYDDRYMLFNYPSTKCNTYSLRLLLLYISPHSAAVASSNANGYD
jgi:hypothetical protein